MTWTDDNEGDIGDAPVIWGGRETWADFTDKAQRIMGAGARSFLCKQVGTEKPQPSFVMILVPGPFLEELTKQIGEQLIADGGVPKDPTDPPTGTVIG